MPSRWSFARKHVLDTSPEQCLERLRRDRTTERHWQRLGSHKARDPKEVPRGSITPAAADATSPRAIAVRLSSVPFLGGGGPRPVQRSRWHRRIAPTAQYWRRCARRQGLVSPRDPSWCPVTSSFEGRPAAGRQRVFVGASSLCRRMFSGLSVVACHCGGTRGPGPVRAQYTCPRFSPGAGVTPAVHSEGPAPLAAPS